MNPEAVHNMDGSKATALLYAAGYDNKHIVEHLLLSRADINHQNNVGKTALHLAAIYGSKAAASVLLSAGADPSIRECSCAEGWTAWDYAWRDWHGGAAVAQLIEEMQRRHF